MQNGTIELNLNGSPSGHSQPTFYRSINRWGWGMNRPSENYSNKRQNIRTNFRLFLGLNMNLHKRHLPDSLPTSEQSVHVSAEPVKLYVAIYISTKEPAAMTCSPMTNQKNAKLIFVQVSVNSNIWRWLVKRWILKRCFGCFMSMKTRYSSTIQKLTIFTRCFLARPKRIVFFAISF